MEEEHKNRSHKSRVTGNKAVRKDELKKKKSGIDVEPNRGRNPKAFQGPSAQSHKSQQKMRSVEKKETALHVPDEDKTLAHLVEEPPLLVVVVGPPGVGKTTLIRSMVKFYANRNLTQLRGPVTVIAGRSRRVTFLECPNTLSAMCDAAKVADLILLMVDGNYGFEMETFEFLNIAQVHGFPKIFGIVSHLDQMKTSKALKKQKKFLRHRFWHEVAAGAKMLCLSPMHHNMYRSTDVLKLHRLLICVQTKVQNWRNTHSCVLIDRHEDVTPPDVIANDENCSRTIAFYGYVRGRPMKQGQMVHLPGVGDFTTSHLAIQEDPCKHDMGGKKSQSQGHKMRHLNEKQKRIYAPYCDIGGVTYDDDAIYVHEDSDKANVMRSGEGLELLRALQRVKPIDEVDRKLDIVRRPVNFADDETLELDVDVEMPKDDSDSDEGSDAEDFEEEFYQRAARESNVNDLSEFGLGSLLAEGGEEGDHNASLMQDALAPRMPHDADAIRITAIQRNWNDDALLRRVKELFVTGSWKKGTKQETDTEGEEGDEDDKASSKGYDSNDEDFDRQIRGEEPLDPKNKQWKTERSMKAEDHDDDDDAALSEDDDPMSSRKLYEELGAVSGANRNATNALAGIRSSSSKQAVAHGKQYHGGASKKEAESPVDDDGYNILDDNDADDDNSNALRDPELEGLVSHFVVKSSSRLDQAEGIDMLDRTAAAAPHGNKKSAMEEEDDDVQQNIEDGQVLTEEQEKLLQKRMSKKKMFDDSYDVDGGKNNTTSYYHHLQREVQERKDEMAKALDMVGDDVERRVQLVGYFSGLYVRFVIEDVPVEFLKHFDPKQPLFAGGLNPGEDQLQMVHARIKRHRWYPRILKAQDPLLLSLGWRRIQTQPIFAQEDPNGRVRYLKYTPLHMHCYASFYAPVTPTNTGFIAIPVAEQRVPNFRCYATGYTIGNDQVTAVVKKLKLTGTPQQIQKTTAFIRGLFNSDIEAAKFVGAKVKSVSGIRGMIKSVIKGKQGLVRCTFEDKILKSDIVFIRAWKPVDPPRYCAIVRSRLDPNWTGMRTMAELRRAHNIPLPSNPDSEYREIKRRQRGEGEDVVDRVMTSRALRSQLPFEMKEQYIPLKATDGLRTRAEAAIVTAPEPREMRKAALLNSFEDKADKMDRQQQRSKQLSRMKHKRDEEKDDEEYSRKLKKAKKETARKQEFRTQHKSRK